MRIVLMGTGPFAAPMFEDLLGSGEHDILALYTQPARSRQTARPPPPSPARQVAERAGLPIEDPVSVNDPAAVERLGSYRPDLLVVCDYGQILKVPALETARLGGINLHGSLLPRHRGAAPVQWALLSGDAETGVTVIHMTPRLDAGPCLVQRRLAIAPEDDAVTLEGHLAELGVEAVREALVLLRDWDGQSPLGEVQDASQATRAPRFQKGDGEIDWQLPAVEIRDRVRGLKPWPGTFTHWQAAEGAPVRLILEQVRVLDEPAVSGAAGEVVACTSEGLDIRAGDGKILRIEQLRPAGKRQMSAAEFLRGNRCQPGHRLA